MPVVSHDVTALLREGDNVLGVELADGWWAGRISFLGRSAQYGDLLRASWQLELHHHDGRHETRMPAGADVLSGRGPIDWSDLFIGERRDARLEQPGWNAPGFQPADPQAWTPCVPVPFDRPVHPFHGEPVRALMQLPARRVWTTPNGDVVADFGQVLAGRVALRVRGPRGTVVRLEHAEALGPDGNLAHNIFGFAKDQADEYVLAGDEGGETWQPEFTFHGFRYVRVIGWPGQPDAGDLTAVVIGSDLETTAGLRSSDPRLDQLFHNTLWSQRSNFLAVPTDCPQRERAGYTGDLQIFAETAATLMGVAAFLERWLADVRRDQARRGGGGGVIVPEPPAMGADFGAGTLFGEIRTPAGWADAITIAPWALYRHYGDRRFLEDNLDAMRAWVAFQTAQAGARNPARLSGVPLPPERAARLALLWNGGLHFGDWLAPSTMVGFDEHPGDAILRAPKLTSEIVGPAFQVCSLQLLARAEAELGHHEAAQALQARLAAVRAAFAAEYLGENGAMSPDLQGLYVLALAFDLAPEPLRPRLVARLVDLVHRAGDHLDTGFLSVPYLLDVLWDHGERDLARKLLMQDTAPSWLYEVAMGATTVWEAWHAVHEDGSVEPVSLNHYAFGCVIDWVMRRQAGIELGAPGYRVVRLAPDLDGPLTACQAHVDTPYGRVAIDWRRSGGSAVLDVEVPVGVTAHVALDKPWSSAAGAPLVHGRHTLHATRA
jgi:alpha-L-rhamnosidase